MMPINFIARNSTQRFPIYTHARTHKHKYTEIQHYQNSYNSNKYLVVRFLDAPSGETLVGLVVLGDRVAVILLAVMGVVKFAGGAS